MRFLAVQEMKQQMDCYLVVLVDRWMVVVSTSYKVRQLLSRLRVLRRTWIFLQVLRGVQLANFPRVENVLESTITLSVIMK